MPRPKEKQMPEDKARIGRIEKKLLHDLEALTNDWKKLFAKKNLAKKKAFLKKIAGDIKELENDSAIAEQIPEIQDAGLIIHDLLTTPWGVPFNYDTTLLEAALDFEHASHQRLAGLLENFTQYSSLVENDFLRIFGELCSSIRGKT